MAPSRANSVYRALVRNRAQLTYSAVGAWLEGTAAAPPKVGGVGRIWQAQLKLQDEAAAGAARGPPPAGRAHLRPHGSAAGDRRRQRAATSRRAQSNRAAHLIEDFMIAANEVMARTLRDGGCFLHPPRGEGAGALAAHRGAGRAVRRQAARRSPTPAALNAFLMRRKQADPVHYPDLSLSVLKLMGPGEYVLLRPGDPAAGPLRTGRARLHAFHRAQPPLRRPGDAAAAQSALRGAKPPYADAELDAIARNCTLKEDAARKVRAGHEQAHGRGGSCTPRGPDVLRRW